MRSITQALVWEIWRRHRPVVAAIIALTAAGRVLDLTAGASTGSSRLVDLLGMASFLLLFATFNYTDSGGTRGLGRFPHRLFTLPVSSLRLVVVPMLAGVVSVEMLYVVWMRPLAHGGSASLPFVAVLLGAFIVFYQTILWTLDWIGPLRLVVVGAVAVVVFAIGVLPSFPPSPPPAWRSEPVLAALVAGAAIMAFLLAWRHVVRVRRGGGTASRRLQRLIASAGAAIPARRSSFASHLDALFWFEWRCSGLVLPVLVGGVIVVILGPLSWLVRDNAADTFRVLLGTLAAPVALAIPVGMAFSRPAFWSEDLSLPALVAVSPLTDEEIIAVKVKVALASAVASWLLVLSFVFLWLPLWANLDHVSLFAIRLWAFHGRSVAAVYAVAALIAIAGTVLTWRFLVSRLWSGQSGKRALFLASAMSVVVVVIAGAALDADRLPGWLLEDPARMGVVVWIASVAVIVKYWLAAYSWRGVSTRFARRYLLMWGVATICVLTFSLEVWRVVHIYAALDSDRFQSLMILGSLLAVPLARVGFAPKFLTRNRHR
jgi:hypothetical protein